MRALGLVLVVLGCGGGRRAATTAPPAEPVSSAAPEQPAAPPSTPGDPSQYRFATVVAARKPPARLWQDGDREGRLVTSATSTPDRIAVALTATGQCDAATTCTFYEHPMPHGQQRAASRTWHEYGPDRRFALAWGNLENGPAGVLVEIKAGTTPFWHMHGRDVRMVVLAGTVEYRESGKPAHALAPGSYVQQSGGYKHTEGCTAGTDCVLYIHSERGIDVKPM